MILEELRFASLQRALCPRGASKDIYVMELALQRALEATVATAPLLQSLACNAFQSFVRAYAAHSKAEKRVLHVGQLHLGHLAKAFALKETPSLISRQQTKRRQQAAPTQPAKKRKGSHLRQLAAYGGEGGGAAGSGGGGVRGKRQAGSKRQAEDDAAHWRAQERQMAASEFSAAF